jgi:hypothetical protein
VARGIVGLGGVVALIGALHLPAGRALLRQVGGCPVGTPLAAADADQARAVAWSTVRGVGAAPARPALGFALGETTRDGVRAWADQAGAACVDEGASLRCAALPAGLWGDAGPGDELRAGFDGAGALVSVVVSLSGRTPEAASAAWSRLADGLDAQLGAKAARRGDGTAAGLARGGMAQAVAEARFEDFRASVTATQLGAGRVTVRAVYQLLPPEIVASRD